MRENFLNPIEHKLTQTNMGDVMGYVGLRLPDDLIRKIDAIAQKERNPRSTVIRRILSEALNDTENERVKISSNI